MPADTSIAVSDVVWEALVRRKKRGDTFDDVLRDLLQLEDGENEQQPGDQPEDTSGGDIDAILKAWEPDTEVNAKRAREETLRVVAWLREQDERMKRSEISAACAGESELSERSWWERAVQPGLRHLADHDLVEYRPGHHDYRVL